MRKFIQFTKTTIIGGLVVIVPLAIIAFVVGDTLNELITAAKPYTTDLPFNSLTNTLIAAFIVLAGIVAVCFVAGFLLSTFWGDIARRWLEKTVLERIPMYSTLRSLTQQFAGIEGANYPIVEVDLYGTQGRVLGVLMEELPNNRQIVYVPSSPLVTIGQVHILPKTQVTLTTLSMADTISCLSQMGLEAKQLYANAG